MPLPTSDGIATDVLNAQGAPEVSEQVIHPSDAETEAMADTDVISSPASGSASNRDAFPAAFATTPFDQDGRNGKDRGTSADSAPISSGAGPVWSAGTLTGNDQQPQAPSDIKGSTLLWGAFLLLVGGLLIATGLGLRLDFTTTAIACLAGLGVLFLVVALIPKRRRSVKP